MAASSCVHEPLQETDRTSSSAVPWMEPLWSPVVANSGNRRQIEEPRKPQKQAKTVATGCHPLPEKFHGKEGLSGSSPEEGLIKTPAHRLLELSGPAALPPAC